jgi:PhoH-like ATPase
MRKTYILDTSVLIHDPHSFKSFQGNDVIIPVSVLGELDKLKTFPNEAGKNARICVRLLDEITKQGDVIKGIKIENDIIIKIDNSISTAEFGDPKYADNQILWCAFSTRQNKKNKKSPTVLVSKDINLRVRARAFNVIAEDYETNKVDTQELYLGHRKIVSDEIGEAINSKGYLDCVAFDELSDLHPNECLYIEGSNGKGLALGRRSGDKVKLIKPQRVWGLESKNKEQAMAIDLMMDRSIPLVSLVGIAGTGKTLCAIGTALEMVLEKKMYQKLIVYRPLHTVGKDLGFLPGTAMEKIMPQVVGIMDTFEFLFSSSKGDKWKTMFEMYMEKGIIEIDAIAYIRGRSIPNALILIDEVQNISQSEIKTLLSRLSDGSKCIITGDIEQIDNPSLDSMDNGLTKVIETFKDSRLAGHVTLVKGERSELATEVARLL